MRDRGKQVGNRMRVSRGAPRQRRPVTEFSPSCTRVAAFTLIELLVVIAVIAVLLAILIPVTRAAREQGQRAVCLSNLHQLTMAWVQYADDHDGKLVCGAAFGATTATRRLEGWMATLLSTSPRPKMGCTTCGDCRRPPGADWDTRQRKNHKGPHDIIETGSLKAGGWRQ